MNNSFPTLPYSTITPGTVLRRPTQAKQIQVSLDDPAILLMTDFERVMPITISSMLPIQTANDRMVDYGVRLLFVTDDDHTILGLITADDILGERPIKHIQQHGGNFNEITVSDIMTRQSQLEVIDFSDLNRASVGEIVETMRTFNRQHALVVEKEIDNFAVRGLLSTTRIGQQLGINVEPSNRARTFQELELALISAA